MGISVNFEVFKWLTSLRHLSERSEWARRITVKVATGLVSNSIDTGLMYMA